MNILTLSDIDLLATEELEAEPTFIIPELAGEINTDSYEYLQSILY